MKILWSGEAQVVKGMTDQQPRLAEALGYTETVAGPQNNNNPKESKYRNSNKHPQLQTETHLTLAVFPS